MAGGRPEDGARPPDFFATHFTPDPGGFLGLPARGKRRPRAILRPSFATRPTAFGHLRKGQGVTPDAGRMTGSVVRDGSGGFRLRSRRPPGYGGKAGEYGSAPPDHIDRPSCRAIIGAKSQGKEEKRSLAGTTGGVPLDVPEPQGDPRRRRGSKLSCYCIAGKAPGCPCTAGGFFDD